MKEHPYVHCSVIHNSHALEAAQVSISRWVGTKVGVHVHIESLPGHKKEGDLTFCNNMGGPGKYYAKK